jgi:hypothetical protein
MKGSRSSAKVGQDPITDAENVENVENDMRGQNFDNALDSLCQSSSWSRMLETIQRNTSKRLKEKGYGRYSELTAAEQASFVEREFYEMQQANEPVLQSFGTRLNKAVDDELLRLLYKSNAGEVSHISNVDYLSSICSSSIQSILKSSPPEFATAAKLFLNRSLPPTQRQHVWYASLDLPSVVLDTASYGRLAPSLDVILSRRCYEVLDSYFPDYSTRSMAAACKTAIANFMRAHNVQLPYTSKNFETTDRLLFVLIPVVHALQVGGDRGLALTYRPVEGQAPDPRVVDRLLATIMGPRHLDQIKFKESGAPAGMVAKSLTMSYCMKIIDRIDADYLFHLMELEPLNPIDEKRQALARREEEMASAENGGAAVDSADMDGPQNDHGDDDGDRQAKRNKEATNMDLLDLRSFRKFEGFVNAMLLRGLSGLVSEKTLLFVWDQCFITSFSRMLPVVLAALVMGAKDEIMRLKSLRSAIDSFLAYCQSVDGENLQYLLTVHCKADLMDLFDIEGNYALGLSQDGVLQAIYRKLMPVDADEEALAADPDTIALRDKNAARKAQRKARKSIRKQAGGSSSRKSKSTKGKSEKREGAEAGNDDMEKDAAFVDSGSDSDDSQSTAITRLPRPSELMSLEIIQESASQESLLSDTSRKSTMTENTLTSEVDSQKVPPLKLAAKIGTRQRIATFISKMSPRRASETNDSYDERMQNQAAKVAREGGIAQESPRTGKALSQYFNISPRSGGTEPDSGAGGDKRRGSMFAGLGFGGKSSGSENSDGEAASPRPSRAPRKSIVQMMGSVGSKIGSALSPRRKKSDASEADTDATSSPVVSANTSGMMPTATDDSLSLFPAAEETELEEGNTKGSDEASDRGSDKASDKASAKGSDKGNDKASDKGSDKGNDKASDKGIDKGNDKASDKGNDKASDKGSATEEDSSTSPVPAVISAGLELEASAAAAGTEGQVAGTVAPVGAPAADVTCVPGETMPASTSDATAKLTDVETDTEAVPMPSTEEVAAAANPDADADAGADAGAAPTGADVALVPAEAAGESVPADAAVPSR